MSRIAKLGIFMTGAIGSLFVKIWKLRTRRYWALAAASIALGVVLGHYLSSHDEWLEARYSVYGLMQETNWKKPYVQHTFVVTIDDDDYWKGDFNRRTPIRRDLLVVIVSRLADAQARVIAVDFDLRSPVPDGNPRETPVYQHETDELLAAINKACSDHHAVVLPATIRVRPGQILRAAVGHLLGHQECRPSFF